jgi:ElaA protein
MQMPKIHWNCLKFHELTVAQLYEILRLRSTVFVVEQNCVYQDLDGNDQNALHLMGHHDNNLLCYTRLLAPGVKYEGASIGRVITNTSARGAGLGKQLMIESIKFCESHWSASSISISAQQYLEKFYSELDFKAEDEPYMEDGIPHIKMVRDNKSG